MGWKRASLIYGKYLPSFASGVEFGHVCLSVFRLDYFLLVAFFLSTATWVLKTIFDLAFNEMKRTTTTTSSLQKQAIRKKAAVFVVVIIIINFIERMFNYFTAQLILQFICSHYLSIDTRQKGPIHCICTERKIVCQINENRIINKRF